MNYGPLIFLAAFFALCGSWVGFVLTPQMQVGQLQPTNSAAIGADYPLGRPGLAREGLDVYRANGCAYCHSQQVGQTATVCDVELTQAGTNTSAVVAALSSLLPALSANEANGLLLALPKRVLRGLTKEAADNAAKSLNAAGAKASAWVVPVGPDIARGWGKRRTVARDFLYDSPVMLGAQRVGPDLADVGARRPDENWHLRHLYAPQRVDPDLKKSSMPPYRYLFEVRKIEREPSPDALPRELSPRPGFEIVPRREARALAAYLVSLRADAPLFEAPLTIAGGPPSATGTNSPAGTNGAAGAIPAATNAPAQ